MHDRHLSAIREAAQTLRTTAQGRLDAEVPSCPGWDMAGLVAHTGSIHAWVASLIVGAPEQVRRRSLEPAPEGGAVLDWFADVAGQATDLLEQTDPVAPIWTWAGPDTTDWWTRRLAQETVVHRWDAQNAVGDAAPIPPDLAVDGIDEFLDVFTPLIDASAFEVAGGTLHLHATDTAGEWLVRFDVSGVHVEREHAKGDVALRGEASDLLLALWGRRAVTDLDSFGDLGAFARFRDAASF